MPAELRSPGSIARVCLIVFAILFTFLGQAQTTPDSDQFPIFRTSTSLVLVDVMALDPTSGLPINNLTREDFRMYDNDAEVPITTFDAGAHFDTRSIALWFVVICGEQNRSGAASDLFIGNEASFRPALDDLDKNDRVGVAHWCDNGDFKLDQPPTENKDAAIAKLGQALQPIPFIAPPGNRIGEIAFQRLVRSIISNAQLSNPQPLPVVVMLHSDYTGQPPKELNLLMDDFLETSGIMFGIKDADVPEMPDLSNGEIARIFHYMSEQTGGRYYSVKTDEYGAALRDVILQLHFRYELGFKPAALDGKRHRLQVELVGAAKETYKSSRLRYRPQYIPVAPLATR